MLDFFCQENEDEVKCFWCLGTLKGWEQGDVPIKEHAK
jgi:hypothetical protein